MATGRTTQKWYRAYINGYDMSGYARTCGPLQLSYDEADLTGWSDTVKGYLRNHAHVTPGTLNTVFDNTATSGIHAILGSAGSQLTVLVAIGIRGAPADGDPCFGGQFLQGAYQVVGEGPVLVTVPFTGWTRLQVASFACPWGDLLHANAARLAATGANTDTGIDNPTGGQTLKGGYFMYHVLAGDGTATLSVDDSANNAAWAALSGATSGEIDCSSVQHGLVALGNGATVRQYLRWQISFNTATTVTFVSAFMRNY